MPRKPRSRWSKGLSAYWSFDNCDAADDSGNGHNGRLFDDVSCTDGVFGNALAFDGDDDYVQVSSFVTPPNAFTYALWFKPDRTLNSGRTRQDLLYGDVDNERFRPHITFNFNEQGRITLLVRIDGENFNDVSTRTNRWNANTWYHLAFTCEWRSFSSVCQWRTRAKCAAYGTEFFRKWISARTPHP